MANDTVIADVGETLVQLLQDNMSDLVSPEAILLFSPGEIEAGDTPRLTLFLYQVIENDYLKNQEMQPLDATVLRYPPLTLDLFYMLTAYPASGIEDRTERTLEAHRLLGRAMRIFYDNAILSGLALKGGLAGTDVELRITLTTISMENLIQMWTSFESQPYRPSVFYQVTPVPIDSVRQRAVQRVVEKNARYYQLLTGSEGG